MNGVEATFRLANIFGLDLDKQQHSIAIADALQGVEDYDDFISFYRENKEAVQYANRLEKLDTLATRYKREQIERKINKETARNFSERVAQKVTQCRNFVEERGAKFRDVAVAGERLFTEQELRALASLGLSTTGIIEVSRRGDLQEMLEQSFVENAKKALAEPLVKQIDLKKAIKRI